MIEILKILTFQKSERKFKISIIWPILQLIFSIEIIIYFFRDSKIADISEICRELE